MVPFLCNRLHCCLVPHPLYRAAVLAEPASGRHWRASSGGGGIPYSPRYRAMFFSVSFTFTSTRSTPCGSCDARLSQMKTATFSVVL